MERESIEVAREFFSGELSDWPGEAFKLLAEDVVVQPSNGQIYIGHEGYAQWYEEHVQQYEQSALTDAAYEDLEGGWVLVKGSISSRRRGGEQERIPGCWLARVRDGKISAALYYRTEQDALAALRK
jgi:hypothetical protein